MSIGAVITTCCMDTEGDPDRAGQSGVPYRVRREWIHDLIVPGLKRLGVAEIVVTGVFEHGAGYTYHPMKQVYRNCRDVLGQRQYGYDAFDHPHNAFWFQMDDHIPERPGGPFFEVLDGVDIMSPERYSRAGVALNSGWNGVGYPDEMGPYIHTHGVWMSRHAIEECPWSWVTPVYRFDVVQTMFWRDRKLLIQCSHDCHLVDLETP